MRCLQSRKQMHETTNTRTEEKSITIVILRTTGVGFVSVPRVLDILATNSNHEDFRLQSRHVSIDSCAQIKCNIPSKTVEIYESGGICVKGMYIYNMTTLVCLTHSFKCME